MSNYHVSGKNKSFKVTKEGGKRASYINVPTQKEAIVVAKKLYSENGGGEVRIHSEKGPIRDSDTVKPGNDPRNIPG